MHCSREHNSMQVERQIHNLNMVTAAVGNATNAT